MKWIAYHVLANRTVRVRDLRRYASGTTLQRQGVARNPKTPTDVLDVLADDTDDDVALSVASHRNTAADALARLAVHGNGRVRAAVASNPSAPDDAAGFAGLSV